jgi:hypothetical protein
MLATYRVARSLLMISDDQERKDASSRKRVIRTIGRSNLGIETISTRRGALNAFIANRFSSGFVPGAPRWFARLDMWSGNGRIFLRPHRLHLSVRSRISFTTLSS